MLHLITLEIITQNNRLKEINCRRNNCVHWERIISFFKEIINVKVENKGSCILYNILVLKGLALILTSSEMK